MKKIYYRLAITLFTVLLVLSASSASFGAATITIINADGAGEGFNDPTVVAPVGGNSGTTLGQQRLIAFTHGANLWAATLTSTQPIVIQAQFNPQTCTATSAVLGAAGAVFIHRDFANAPFAATWYNESLANKLSGNNLNASHDINATFNLNLGQAGCLTGRFFYYGLDSNNGTNVDLVAVVQHEIAHGLGFQTFTSGSTGAYNSGFPSIYDRFLIDGTSGLSWLQMTNSQRAASAINSRRLAWTGPQVATEVPQVLSLGVPLIQVNSPSSIAGRYEPGTASYGPAVTSGGVTGSFTLVNDGVAPTSDGCEALAPGSLTGQIAVVDRGLCSFKTKTLTAQNAGAIGVVLVNNAAGSPAPGLGDDATIVTPITIPTLSLTQSDGNLIKAQLPGVNGSMLLDNTVRSGADMFGKALLFSPDPFNGGSSVSHWDTSGTPNQLMEPSINDDLTQSLIPPQDLSFGQMRDIGWVAQTVPTTITKTGGDNQNTALNQTFATPITVDTAPAAAGLTVTWTANPGAGGANATFAATGSRFATSTTNAAGEATAPPLTAGGQFGTISLNATVAGAGSTTFNLLVDPVPVLGAACLTDTAQADFQAGTTNNTDVNSSPGNVTLLNPANLDQQNTNIGTSGVGINVTSWSGQTFTPAVTGQLRMAEINLFCSGCTGTTPALTLSLRATAANVPTGADLATATIPGFSSGAAVYYPATFSAPVTLTAGTKYALVIRPTANPSVGTYAITRSGTATVGADVYAGGDRVSSANSGATWSIPLSGSTTPSVNDAGFRTFMQTGFVASGNFESSAKDSNPVIPGTTVWSTIAWNATVPAGTTLQFQAAASNSFGGPFNFVGPDGTAGTFFTNGGSLAQFNGMRYLKYKAFLTTTNPAVTPTVNDVTICFVNQATPVISTNASPAITLGAGTVSDTATLSGGNAPTGTITFRLFGPNNSTCTGAAVFTSPVVVAGNGNYTSLPFSPAAAGTYRWIASYSGDVLNAAAAGACNDANESVVVMAAPTSTTIISDNPDPSVSGQPVTVVYSATSGAGTPTGNVVVTFSPGGETCTGTVAAGQCTVPLIAPGVRTITAAYAGDANFTGSSDTELHTVGQAGTTTTIAPTSPDPTVVGQAVPVSVTVAAAAPGVGTPTGTVTVSTPGETSCTITLAAGTGMCSITFTSAGAKTITATYNGSTNFSTSTDTEAHTVNAAATTTAITSDNPDASVTGETVVVNYTVVTNAPGAGTPTGNVVVTVSGGTETCTGTVAAGTCSLALNSVGTRTITATYSGNANFATSFATASHTVNKAATTTAITSDTPDPSTSGTAVTVNYTVTANSPGGGTPTGNVVVTASGGTETCTATAAAGSCSITLNGSGPRTLTATYAGDANYTGSSDTEDHNVGVSISGNIQQNNAPSPSTALGGVTVDLTGTSTDQATTDANGNYTFSNLVAGGTYTVTPSGGGRTYSPVNRTYTALTTNVTNANFLAFDPGQLQRNLTVRTTFVDSPNQATVPIIANVLGNERRFDFSLTFNSAILTGTPTVACGPDAPGCTIVQTNAAGAVGISVTLAGPLAAGERDIVRVTFNTLSGGQSNTPVLFGDSPTARQTLDAGGNPLATSYTSGFVVFTAAGLEGDLQTRFTGDGVYRSNDVEQQRKFVSGTDQPNGVTNEFERADVAPFATKGDGRLNATDLQLTMNYVAGLNAQQTAGGPDVAAARPAPMEERDATGRTVRIVAADAPSGKASVSVEIDSLGDEVVGLFTLNFDASRLSNPTVTLAEGTSTGITLTANTRKAADGQVTVLIDSATPLATSYGARVVTITFDVQEDAPAGETPITFDSGSFSNAEADSLDANYKDGSIPIKRRGLFSRLFENGPFSLFGMVR